MTSLLLLLRDIKPRESTRRKTKAERTRRTKMKSGTGKVERVAAGSTGYKNVGNNRFIFCSMI